MPLTPDQNPTSNRRGGFVTTASYTALPDGQTKLFDVIFEGPDYDPGEVLTFPLVAVVELDVTGEPSIDAPDVLVKKISVYDEGSCRPVLEVEPGKGETTVASSLLAGAILVTNSIYARWDVQHADMLSSLDPVADHTDIAGTFGDSSDWIAKE